MLNLIEIKPVDEKKIQLVIPLSFLLSFPSSNIGGDTDFLSHCMKMAFDIPFNSLFFTALSLYITRSQLQAGPFTKPWNKNY
jgi:hypothetical protein